MSTIQTVRATNVINGPEANQAFAYFLQKIFSSLGFADDYTTVMQTGDSDTILNKFYTAFTTQELEIIMNDGQLQALLDADVHIANLSSTDATFQSYLVNNLGVWESFKKSLAKLQALAILRKIRPGNCDGVISAIVTALTAKVEAVNNILANNLEATSQITLRGGGKSADPYVHKYWKYKFKYDLAKYEKDNL